ncbi:hypothetical protein [Aquimarina sp. RZ0]|uniref:hypothetical protein n=1 Tax=Aquimarina sp. RZ0 TaxID=2607730 RepID=UPI0011F1BDD0|nr:hypothetical protein [Aquimarina sp. RZ0]KAA1245834.1 hypothetical protein F0000_10585 [Aquimarina sp. RZ0]
MKNIQINIKTFVVILFFTLIWFTTFSGRSELLCDGDPIGLGYGNIVIWNMSNPVSSLSKLVDIKMFLIDFTLSYVITAILFFLVLIIFKKSKTIFQSKKWFIALAIFTILISGFFSIEFMFDIVFDTMDCDKISDTYSFGLDL